MEAYLNAHHAIDNLRASARAAAAAASAAAGPGPGSAAAAAAAGQGPRVVVAGPTDAGKSTLCRLLLNWAVRAGAAPAYLDLDVGQGTVTAPGCIAAAPIEAPVGVEEGYPTEVPLVFFHGHAAPADAPELYKFLVERAAAALDRRSEAGARAAADGLVANTLGWIDGAGYDILLHVVRALRVS